MDSGFCVSVGQAQHSHAERVASVASVTCLSEILTLAMVQSISDILLPGDESIGPERKEAASSTKKQGLLPIKARYVHDLSKSLWEM